MPGRRVGDTVPALARHKAADARWPTTSVQGGPQRLATFLIVRSTASSRTGSPAGPWPEPIADRSSRPGRAVASSPFSVISDTRASSAKGSSMTARLQRIHAILRSGNVPAALVSRPHIGSVLLAGTPGHGPGDVLVRDIGGRLWLVHSHGTDVLPDDSADTWVADVVKVRVVQAWAERGDPEARAVLAALANPSQPHHPAEQPHAAQPRRPASFVSTVSFIDPLVLAAEMFQTAHRFGWAVLTGSPAFAGFAWSSAWGAIQTTRIRR